MADMVPRRLRRPITVLPVPAGMVPHHRPHRRIIPVHGTIIITVWLRLRLRRLRRSFTIGLTGITTPRTIPAITPTEGHTSELAFAFRGDGTNGVAKNAGMNYTEVALKHIP